MAEEAWCLVVVKFKSARLAALMPSGTQGAVCCRSLCLKPHSVACSIDCS